MGQLDNAGEMMVFQVPLIGGGSARLILPRHAKRVNWEYLKNILNMWLDGVGPAVFIEPEEPAPPTMQSDSKPTSLSMPFV